MTQQLKLKFEPPQKPLKYDKQLNLLVENFKSEMNELTKDLPVYIEMIDETDDGFRKFIIHLKNENHNSVGCCLYSFDIWQLYSSLDLIRTLYVNNVIDFNKPRHIQGLMKFFHHSSEYTSRRFFKGLMNKPQDYLRGYILHQQTKYGIADLYFLNKMLRDSKTNTQAERVIDIVSTHLRDIILSHLDDIKITNWEKPSENFRDRKARRSKIYMMQLELKQERKERNEFFKNLTR